MSIGGSHPDPDPAEGTAANGLPRESVWDYPRPPAIRPELRPVTVSLGGIEIARSAGAVKVCETAGPPTVYIPPEDVVTEMLIPVDGGSYCEWKGEADYFDVIANGERSERAAWTYRSPKPDFESIRGWIAFYPGRAECRLGEERVEPQPGQFYGGWVTAEICGPFKGVAGSGGW